MLGRGRDKPSRKELIGHLRCKTSYDPKAGAWVLDWDKPVSSYAGVKPRTDPWRQDCDQSIRNWLDALWARAHVLTARVPNKDEIIHALVWKTIWNDRKKNGVWELHWGDVYMGAMIRYF